MYRYLLLIFLVVCTTEAHSRPSGEEMAKEVTNAIFEELITCGSLFGIMTALSKSKGEKETAEITKKTMNFFIKHAHKSATLGRSKEAALQYTKDKLKSSLQEMKKTAGSDYSNAPSLWNAHEKRCKWMIKNTKEFTTQTRDRVFKKHGM